MRDVRKTGLLITYSTFSGGGLTTTSLEFDASIKEAHDLKAEVTYYPVESGMPVADGVRLTPRTFSADVAHTTTPSNGKKPNAERDRLMANELVTLWKSRTVCSVTTEDGVLENMVLSDVSWSRTQETGEGLFATLSFTEVVIAERQVTSIPKPVRRRVNRGSQQGALYSEQNLVCAPDPIPESGTDLQMTNYGGTVPVQTTNSGGAVSVQVTRQSASQMVKDSARGWEGIDRARFDPNMWF